MSRIRCSCGHVIIDQTTDLRYKADLLPDQSYLTFFEKVDEIIDSLLEASRNGNRREWIASQFGDKYPGDLTDVQMIGDIVSSRIAKLTRSICQCENCGRILIQKGDSNVFGSYKPEGDDWKGSLGLEIGRL